MGHTTAFRTVTRTGAAACLATGLALLAGGAAGADPLPAPLQQAADTVTGLPVAPSSSLPTPGSGSSATLPGPVDGGADRVTGALAGTGAPSGGTTGTGGSGTGNGSGGASSGTTSTPRSSTGSGSTASTRNAQGSATAPSGQPKASARATSEALTACVIPTGSGSPAVEFDLSVLGNDAGSPLAAAIPQVFTPCPKGAVPADDLAAVDVDVEGLLGACVRITREVAPLQTTLVVLDHDLIKALTDAGLPLQQLVVPCPGGATAPSGPSASTPGAGADPSRGDRPAASAVPGLPDRLAFTGADTVPLAALAVVLLSLGAVLTRQARRLRRSASRG